MGAGARGSQVGPGCSGSRRAQRLDPGACGGTRAALEYPSGAGKAGKTRYF